MNTNRRFSLRLSSARHGWRAACLALAWLALSSAMVGCNALERSAGGQVRLNSIADREQALHTQFTHGVYRQNDETSATMVLFAGPAEQPTRVMTVRLFWVPRAGATPLHAAATNAAMHYMIFGEDEGDPPVVIYSGAGFIFPRDRLGRDALRVRMLDASIRLSEAAGDFTDPIGHGRLTGNITVRHDPEATHEALLQVHDLVHDRLGRPRMVLSR